MPGVRRLRAVEDMVELVTKVEEGADLLLAGVPRPFAPDRVELGQRRLCAVSPREMSGVCVFKESIDGKDRRIAVVDQAPVIGPAFGTFPFRTEPRESSPSFGPLVGGERSALELLDQFAQAVRRRFGTNLVRAIGEHPHGAFIEVVSSPLLAGQYLHQLTGATIQLGEASVLRVIGCFGPELFCAHADNISRTKAGRRHTTKANRVARATWRLLARGARNGARSPTQSSRSQPSPNQRNPLET
jgi:hypothetical protein